MENLVKKVDGNIAVDGAGGGPIDSALAKITDKIQTIDSKIDGAGAGSAGGGGGGPGDMAAPVSSFMGSEMYKLEVGVIGLVFFSFYQYCFVLFIKNTRYNYTVCP